MPSLHFHARTQRDFEAFRAEMERALRDAADKGLRHEWHGRTLRITAPGAKGFIVFDGGSIAAQVQLGFPATLVRDRIADEVRRILERVAEGPVTVDEV